VSAAGGGSDEVRFGSVLAGLETATNRVEGPIRRFVGSNRLNPLPHAGTISVFLLIVVTITGLYITLFFEFGFEDSYSSVAAMEGHPIQRVMRSIHRVSSAMLVVTTVVHAWRTFVAKRFTASRRFRWLTGMLALVVVWLAGVTGYWLIWDVRAQAISEALVDLVSPPFGSLAVAAAAPGESGWVPLFLIWVAHLALTAVVGWALWRHLRKARFNWLPPYRWMWVMGGALIVAAIVFPSGMLDPANPSLEPGAMVLDPYVMFLLPILGSQWGPALASVAILVTVVVAALPWAINREEPPVAVISDTACTGCELCVIDCPYLALSMTADGSLAVVDAETCVGCGICLGSCAFGAISGLGDVSISGGSEPVAGGGGEVVAGGGGEVVIVCSRELRLARFPEDVTVKEVECTGAVSPLTIGEAAKSGSTVHVIGCAPGECSYRTGNTLASLRLTGERQPMLPRRWRTDVTQDWAAPDDLRDLIDHPGGHAQLESVPVGKAPAIRMGAVVLASVLLVGATSASIGFDPSPDDSTVRVVLDHRDGAVIGGFDQPVSGVLSVAIERDGQMAEEVDLGEANRFTEVIDVRLPAGRSDVVVELLTAGDRLPLFADSVDLQPGERLVIEAIDMPPSPGAQLGRDIFEGSGMSAQAGCQICHSLEPGRQLVGPSLAGIAVTAQSRTPGLSAEEYLRESILDPDAYIVEGYRSGQMLPIYEEQLTGDEVDALVQFLLTLEGSP
jgi:ferredoxin